MPTNEKRWTIDQENAISARNGSVIVSAAAGSGKTSVLTERVIRRICEDNVAIDQMLIVTFSNAAAAEMKGRISARIREKLQENPADQNLRKQLYLIEDADICTIHSFCMRLAREYFSELDVSADFRIGDENELNVLKKECITEAIDEAYSFGGEELYELIELLSDFRDDGKIFAAVEEVYDFICAHPFREKWLDETLAMYKKLSNPAESVWGRTVMDESLLMIDNAIGQYNEAVELISKDSRLCESWSEFFANEGEKVASIKRAIEFGDYNHARDVILKTTFDRIPIVKKYEDEAYKKLITDRRDAAKSIVARLSDAFSVSCEDYNEDVDYFRPKVQKLFDIVKRVNELFSAAKKERNLADFDDLESYAIRLFYRDDELTQIARDTAAKYKEIMIDEFQDINDIQRLIFAAISDNYKNVFMVGDVKQSIYGFRKAKPEIFINMRDCFNDFEKNVYPARIFLNANFRSRQEVTETANFIFSQILSRSVGDIDYDQNERLVPCGCFVQGEGFESEIHIVDTSKREGQNKIACEAAYIAEKIKKMVSDGFMITGEDGSLRPCEYGDFCILMRSLKDRTAVYQEEFKKAGVSLNAQGKTDFFNFREIMMIMSFLKAIDNPINDLALVSVMMSPIYRFSADDISALRSGKGSIYKALQRKNDDKKAMEFLSEFNSLRNDCSFMSADEAIEHIYAVTGMYNMVAAMNNGVDRRHNLDVFMSYAIRYSTLGHKGIHGFLAFMEKMAEDSKGITTAPSVSESNAVKLITVHHAKGLEFPICILADCSHQYNMMDLRRGIFLDDSLGFGCARRDLELSEKYTTLQQTATQCKMLHAIVSEELRVLYVALTRPKDKLIITMTSDDPDKMAESAAASVYSGNFADPYGVLKTNNFASLILACAIRHRNGGILRERAGASLVNTIDSSVGLKVFIAPPPIANGERCDNNCLKDTESVDVMLERITKAASREKKHSFTPIPIKVSVSQISKKNATEKIAEFKKPSMLSRFALTPSQRGTALHRFMQFADFDRTAQDVEKEITRLVEKKFISQKEADSINVENLVQFVNSPLFEEMRTADEVLKEYRFLMQINSRLIDDYKDLDDDGDVIVQGVVDCILIKNDEVTIIDYKTDFVNDPEQLRRRYSGQVELYTRAVEEGLGRKVTKTVLYSLHLGKEIKIQ